MSTTFNHQADRAATGITLDSGKLSPTKSRSKSNGGYAAAEPETRSRQILSAIIAFRDGNFSVRLPTDWDDTDGRIAEAFNQTIAHEEHIASEVTRLSVSVGKEGRLKQRMSVPGA